MNRYVGHAFSAMRLLIAGAACALVGTAAGNSIQILDRSGSGDLLTRLSASPSLDPTPRRITISGTKLTIPVIGSAEQSQYGQLLTIIELLNISDSDAELSFSLRDSSGNLLEMPFYNTDCPACPAIPLSSDSMTLEAKGAERLQIVRQNPAKVGWAEFSFEPGAEVAVSAQLWVTAADGTASFAGIPPTSAFRQAFLYLDNTSDFDTSLVFVNLSATSRQGLALQFRAADDKSVECEARADLAPLGQAVLNAVETLPCSVGKIGLLSVQGQRDFTGIALVDNWEHDGLFTRQFVQRESSGGRNFGVGDRLPGVPSAGDLFPASSWATEWPGVSFSGTLDNSVTYLSFDNGEYIELRSGTRYTCHAAGGCRVRNGIVTEGTIVGSGGTGDETPQDSQNGGRYTLLESWTVSSGRVQFLLFSSRRCVNLKGGSINGVTYTIHESKWQRRPDASSTWVDIPGTEHTGGVCSYTPIEAGEYRGVAEISIDGERGTYSTKNILTEEPLAAPDLVVGSPTVSDSRPDAGERFTLRATVRNQGRGRSAATTLRYYRSSDATISSSDVQVGTDSVGALDASESSAESISLAAPSAAGTYYYGACISSDSGESDTSNNCSTGVRITVQEEDGSTDSLAEVTGLTLTRVGDSVRLRWDPVPGATHYVIYHCRDIGSTSSLCDFRFSWSKIADDVTGTTYLDEDRIESSVIDYVHFYNVRACNRSGCMPL